MHDFTTVANPKEVGSYTIFTSFKSKYPQHSTGLMWRVLRERQVELGGTLKGKAFQQIAVKGSFRNMGSRQLCLMTRHSTIVTADTDMHPVIDLFWRETDSRDRGLITENELSAELTVIYMPGGPVKIRH